VDVAAMHLGATSFGIYHTFAQQQVEYVLRDANCAVVITEQAFAGKLLRARRACPKLTHIVSVDGGEDMLSLAEVDDAGIPTSI
jgi:long-subunit acyl-CoA synthetase (AMP-forming)